jgi:hypothetical protein
MKPAAFFTDDFSDDRPTGKVIGRENPQGIMRLGVDQEGVIGIDHRALRIQPLVHPGWGRSGLAYGPYQRENGLAFAVLVLNGHNTSQTGPLVDNMSRRLYRWARGSNNQPLALRLLRWTVKGRKSVFVRQVRRWAQILLDHRNPGAVEIDENMAVGWFQQPAVDDPVRAGNSFIVHAAGAENGELWARMGGFPLPVVRGLQNIPMLYLVVVRDKGAVYYAASLPNSSGAAAFPYMRPLAVDWQESTSEIYAGIQQSVLGQIGFRVDTRVFSTQVTKIGEYEKWYGSAHAADSLRGTGALEDTQAETGGIWQVLSGQFQRTAAGARASSANSLAVLDPGQPTGLVHMLVEPPASSAVESSLIWRFQDPANYWQFRAASDGCRLGIYAQGSWSEIAASDNCIMQNNRVTSLQIQDDGSKFSIAMNEQLVFGNPIHDSRLGSACGVGFFSTDEQNAGWVHSFEAHPRELMIPPSIELRPIPVLSGCQVLVGETFSGPPGDLAGKISDIGAKEWRKEVGTGIFELTGSDSARVKASVEFPCPGRTAYSLEWSEPAFADLEVTIDPPGTKRGQGEKGRAGLIFWQDSDNYIIVSTWLDDIYDGTSISSFFHLDGFEELYDAVWTNVGRRVEWGRPYTLRVGFDGLIYTAFVDSEPVLYRSLTDVYPGISRLSIRRVGIVANWEWGNDTGSTFKRFLARGKG